MRIGIDARLYGISDRGIGRYTEKLIEYLEKIDSENEYFIFLRQDGFNKYQSKNYNFHKVLINIRPYSVKEQIIFPIRLYQYHLDLVHFPHFNVPIFYRKPFLITIHDLIISKFPESRRKATTLPYFLYQVKLIFYQLIIKNAVKLAKKIIVVSKATKKDVMEILKADPKKIEVIYEGVDLIKIQNSNFEIQNYILYVGAAYPHKNLERLLLAFKNLNISHLKLILVGKNDYFYQRLKKYSQKLGLNDQVIFKGEVSDEELANLYQNALFFIFPSLSEGFGLPGLEAMAYGTPVLASTLSSLPEIFGEAAYYFNPYDVEEIKRAMNKLLTDENLRKNLKEKGFKQIKKYSWQRMAEKILEIYKNIQS
ncbi:MAG: glycosyltransferase family 4 protein [Patescibacteria group bacterium]|nr:glycosyltransferase family 4 protein [Patescibacteria group bacterium]